MCTERLPTCAPGTKCPLVSSHPVGKRRMAPLSFTISVGCCIIVLGDLDMRCRLSFVLIYVSLLLLVGCGKNFSISHQTTPSLLTPRTEQTPYPLAPYTEFALPQLSEKDCASGPQGITVGSDGALWFTAPKLNQKGHITLFSPHYSGGPGSIVAGPDGALWMTEVDPHAGLIGRFSPSSARVPESRNVSAATFPCPVVTPIPTAPSTPSPPGS